MAGYQRRTIHSIEYGSPDRREQLLERSILVYFGSDSVNGLLSDRAGDRR